MALALDFVAPTVHVPGVRTAKTAATNGDDKNVPKALRELYSIGDNVTGSATNNKMAVTAFLGQKYDKSALHDFWSQYCESAGLTCGDGEPKLVGDSTSGDPGVESMLDIETITGMAGNVEAEFWGFAGHSPDNPENEPFMKWLTQVSLRAGPSTSAQKKSW